MKKTVEIILHEFSVNLRRPSFLFFMIGVPILMVIVFLVVGAVRGDSTPTGTAEEVSVQDKLVEGYVDQSGIIRSIPLDLPAGRLVRFADEDLAKEAMEKGEIESFYIIPPDYLKTGKLLIILPQDKSLAGDYQDWVMRWTMLVNMLGGDADLAGLVWSPVELEEIDLAAMETGGVAPEDECLSPGMGCESNVIISYLPIIILVMLFIIITSGSGMLFTSVVSERQNRTIEVLMVSLHPRQILLGKFVGLGLLALLQNVIWMGTVFALLRLGGNTLQLPAGFQLPISLLVWWILFYLGGYAVYASLMAGAGALTSNLKESSAVTWVVLMPLILGYTVAAMFTGAGSQHNLLLIILSLFPLTSPVVMMMRLTMGGVPIWQTLLSVLLLFLTVFFVMRMVVRMFRANLLLSGQPFSTKRYFRLLFGRE